LPVKVVFVIRFRGGVVTGDQALVRHASGMRGRAGGRGVRPAAVWAFEGIVRRGQRLVIALRVMGVVKWGR
jgi:hypothetical protein